MDFRVLLIGLLALMFQCKNEADRNLLLRATWKTDSVYSYYNGFGFMKFDYEEEPLHQYEPGGKLRMIRGKENRLFFYTLSHGDTLIHGNGNRKTEKYIILKLDESHLTLKKEMKPIFNGANQERYEIRYLSKVK